MKAESETVWSVVRRGAEQSRENNNKQEKHNDTQIVYKFTISMIKHIETSRFI